MKSLTLSQAVKAALLSSAVLVSSSAFAADKELLDMLKANGAITQEQYEKLASKPENDTAATLKKMAWAGKIKIKGDLRLRQEFRNVDGGSSDADSDEDRQRYRARIGVYADVNENTKAGIRLVTGGDDEATSTNETLGDGFAKDDVWMDLAYLNWSPVAGLELIGGKFKKPWQEVSGGLVWDGDLNPEGVAVRYSSDMGLVASAGYLIVNDVDGFSFDEDVNVNFAQLAGKFKTDGVKGKVGVSLFHYDEGEESYKDANTTPELNEFFVGATNQTTEFSIQELFGEIEVKAGLPLKFYAHWAKNADANGPNGGEDTAWLLGVATKTGPWKFSYDYRETEAEAVNELWHDSDFAGGSNDSEGHRFKVAYKIDKNFSIGTTYLDAETGNLASSANRDVKTWQIDLKAKF